MEQSNYRDQFNHIVTAYLSDPADGTAVELPVVDALVEKYPFCQILHVIRSAAHSKTEDLNLQLSRAALYVPQREVLYRAIHRPGDWKPEAAIQEPAIENEPIAESGEFTETATSAEKASAPLEIPEPVVTEPAPTEEPQAGEVEDVTETLAGAEEVPSPHEADASEAAGVTSPEEYQEPQEEELAEQEPAAAPPVSEKQESQASAEDLQAEKLILGNIAGADFFAFERSAVDPRQPETGTTETSPEETPAEQPETNESLSKYDDDKMPYTFLWWLSKTRNEHSHTYQPYVSALPGNPDIKKNAENTLNHQIIENIFHLKNQVDDADYPVSPNTVQFEVKRKEDEIIERFIKEEPQIKPPQAEKIDTENKARKSSEDPNDLVSETLARIYSEQMLFHKAIDTYKKLSLKFPEKSAYFADQIKELEKKIN